MELNSLYGSLFFSMAALTYVGYLQPPKGFDTDDTAAGHGDGGSHYYNSMPVFLFFCCNSACFYLAVCGMIIYVEVSLVRDGPFEQRVERVVAALWRLCIVSMTMAFACAGVASSSSSSLAFLCAVSVVGSAAIIAAWYLVANSWTRKLGLLLQRWHQSMCSFIENSFARIIKKRTLMSPPTSPQELPV